jgi:WS/DGAT/MGAT family acyltransferase
MTERAELFMRDTDAFSWYLESDPGLHATILAVAWLDEAPDVDILTARLDRAIRLVPRFRQRPLAPPGRLATPRWVDAEVDLSFHLRRIGAPWPHTPATVIAYARIEAMSSFDLSRPLWQFTLVEGLAGNRAALIMKVHHSLTDGIGGSRLALLLFETTKQSEVGSPLPATEDPGRSPGTVELVRDALAYDLRRVCHSVRSGLTGALPTAGHVVRDPLGSTSDAWATARSVARFVRPVSRTRSRVMTDRSLDRHLDMLTVDLPDLKQAGVSAGGSLNDAFVASVTGGLRRYHEHHRSEVDELKITMPISIRGEDDPAASNRITLARFDVPVGVADPAERVRLTGSRCRAARNERALPFSNSIAATLNLLPSGVVGSMLKHVDVLASNVPGMNVQIYLAGAPVSGYYAFGPTTGSAVNVTLFTYCGTCCVGITIDTAAVPDCEVLMDCFRQGFDEVLGLVEDGHPVVRPLDDRPTGNPAGADPPGCAVPPS